MHPNYILAGRIILAVVFLIAGLIGTCSANDVEISRSGHREDIKRPSLGWLGLAAFASAVAFAWSAVWP